jgi:6-phosphofructokinase
MKNNKFTSAGLMGFWGMFWSMAGVSLAMSPNTSGLFATLSGFSPAAVSQTLEQVGLAKTLAGTLLTTFGVISLAVGIGYAIALYQDDERCSEVGLRASAVASLLVLVLAVVGGSTAPWAMAFDAMLLLVLGASAVVVAMDKHQDMPMMTVDAERFEAALRQRIRQDEAIERYYEQCRTSSQKSQASR